MSIERGELNGSGEDMKRKVTLIPGDGIGPEITDAVTRILEAAGAELEWESFEAGTEAIAKYGDPLPVPLLDSVKRNGVALKGPVTTPVAKGFASINVRLRKELDLYANFRPIRSLPGVKTVFGDVDLVVVRENTEDVYVGIEHKVVEGVVEGFKIITAHASKRIARFAFDYARKHGRKKVTALHKANIMKLSDGLFLESFREEAKDFPDITADDKLVDNACMQLVMRPQQFDVLVLENLYGDIVSDLAAGLIGGLGIAPGANFGKLGAIFEAVHGSAPDIAGKNIANPTALLQSAVLMLRFMELTKQADLVHRALEHTLTATDVRTRDIGGSASTTEYADAIIASMSRVAAAV